MQGGPGARRGYSRETHFCNLINENEKFKNDLIEALFELEVIDEESIEYAKNVKDSARKSDVDILIKNSNSYSIGCSLKSAAANFNQLDRRWLDDWAKVLNMPNYIKEMIQSSLDRKIINSRDIFITAEQEDDIFNFLTSKRGVLLKEAFIRNENSLKLFVVYDENNKEWFICKVSDIIAYIKKQNITRSSQGVIYFGDFLTLQRKGGDGNITNPPKSSPLHPSNQLQLKIKPISIIEKVKSIMIKES